MQIIPRSRAIIYLALLTGAALALFCIDRDWGSDAGRPPVEASRPDWYQSAIKHYDAFGDSITYGDSFDFEVDGEGHPQKSDTSFQGWPELLGRMLTDETGVVTAVWNMGYPGDRTEKALEKRLPDLLKLQTGSDRALLLTGTNDSNDFEPMPSGAGCRNDACRHTYKGVVFSVINTLKAAGRDTIYLGILTPVWGASLGEPYDNPLDRHIATRNNRIREYNQVITEELAALPGVKLGPDLFACFLSPSLNRFSLFKDALHPNALGQTFIAALWRDVITGKQVRQPTDPCPSPVYILESLEPYAHGHKQNLLAIDDQYYTDESFTLTGIPAELSNGIWVMQANAANQNHDPEYLSFDVGPSPVTVYIAYDPGGTPPVSSSHEFMPAVLSSDLTVSDESIGSFSVVRTTGVTGDVRIGGTRSADSSGNQQAYLVIVVP